MRVLLLHVILLLFGARSTAQLLVSDPFFPTESDAITIVFDASKGNRGLYNYNGDVYIHSGVITDKSTGPGDWKYVKMTWNTNTALYRMTPLGNNRYEYKISNIRSFYGVPAGEIIRKMAFVFRSYNPNGNALEGKTSDLSVDQGNMYLDVYPANAHVIRLTAPESEPRYNRYILPLKATVGSVISMNAVSSKPANLSLRLNGNTVSSAAASTAVSGQATITSSGENVFVAVSQDGTTTAGDTFKIYVAPPVTVESLPSGMKEGVNYGSNEQSATLVLYAPGKNRVNLIGDFNNWQESDAYQMKRTPDGKYFWLTITGLTATTEYAYQYLVDGTLRIGDPYTQKVLDPWNDQYITASTYPGLKPYPAGKTTGIVSILQTKQEAYQWQATNYQRPDQRKLVIYEVLLRDFIEKHDWQTLKDSLGYFRSLGVNALHLMPFNEFEGNSSWGYNPSYYFAPDKYYGPRNTLKAFIDECHKQGIAVIMDMVLNHSFGQSPMVQLYFDNGSNRPSASNPWYNPVARHAFNVGYDMNHESADTKRFFTNVCAFWLEEYKLDGFRFDLSKGFTQKQTCDATGGNCDVNAWSAYDASRVSIWKAYYDSLQLKSPGSYVILEHLGVNDEEKELAAYGMMLWGNMNYNFTEAVKGQVSNSNFRGALAADRGWQQPHLISYMESHDEERSMVKAKNEGLSSGSYNIRDQATALKRNEMAAAFLLSMPGPKLIWQFGELGYDLSINYCSNGTVNNNCRTDPKPIRWNYYQEAGRVSLRNVYKAMLELRKNNYYSDLFVGGQASFDLGNAMKWLQLTSDSSKLVVVGNFGTTASSLQLSFPQAGVWFDLFTGEPVTATGTPQSISLPAGGYKVYLNRNLNGTTPTPVFEVDRIENFNLQLRPNPFTPASVLHYEIPETGVVELRLLDISGRVITSVSQGNKARGSYQYRFDPAVTAKLGKGIYLVQLQINEKRRLLKLLVH